MKYSFRLPVVGEVPAAIAAPIGYAPGRHFG